MKSKKITAMIGLLILLNTLTVLATANTTNDPCYLADGIVTPNKGKKGSMFTYYVRYFDPDGDMPTVSKLMIKTPVGQWITFDMTYIVGDCKTDGAVYYAYIKLTTLGEYKYCFYFENKNDHAVLPEKEGEYFSGPIVTKTEPIEHYALIVCGGGGNSDEYQLAFEKSANQAYYVFKQLGYDDDHIYYLSKKTSDSGVDKYSSRNNIKQTIEELARETTKKSKCFIYLNGHGGTSGFIQIDEGVFITDKELARWIDKIYDYDTLTVTIDCCYAGQFIDDLSKKNRIIITGTDEDSIGYIHNGIGCLFSNAFFSSLLGGQSYGKAWEVADGKIADALQKDGQDLIPMLHIKDKLNGDINKLFLSDDKNIQSPQIDDNGDKKGHGTNERDTLPLGGDGDLALNTYPGYEHDNSKNRNRDFSTIQRSIRAVIDRMFVRFPAIFRMLAVFS